MVDYKKQIEKIINDLEIDNPNVEIDFKEDYILEVNGAKIDVSILDIKEPIEKDDEKTNINKMQILFKTKEGYVLIAEVTEDNEIMIDSEAIKKAGLEERVLVTGSDKIGLREKDEQEKDRGDHGNQEGEKDDKKEQGEENGNKENGDEKKPDLSDTMHKKSNWIKLDLSAEVVKGKILGDLLGCKAEEAYIAPGKDAYDYSIVEGNEESGYKVLDTLERTEGRAPNQKIMSIENNGDMDVNEKQALTMFKCKGKNDEGFTISKLGDGVGQERIEYYRKAYTDLYMSCPVPQQSVDRGMGKPNPETKELMSRKYYSRIELSNKMDMHEEITGEINKQNLPDNINPASDGIQIEELDRKTFREKLINKIVEDEMGTGSQMPGRENYIRQKAERVADKILDEDKDYSVARKEVFGEKEQGGQTPGENRREALN